MQHDENGRYCSAEKIDIYYIERDREREIDRLIAKQTDRQYLDVEIDIFKIVLIATCSFDTNKTTEIFSMKLC